MEENYPEIALNQPKADPRTVLLYRRNFMESSSDHIQDLYRSAPCSSVTASTANCVKTKNMCKYLTAKFSKRFPIEAALHTSSIASSSASLLSSSRFNLLTALPSSSWLSPLSSSALIPYYISCHFRASFINNYLYKTKNTKLICFFLFFWCAIFLQATQALPVRRTATSGRKLILHTNIFRERYHQKLLEEQRRHNQQQQLVQLQLKEQEKYQQQQQAPSLADSPTIQFQQQVQNNHIFSSSQILRRLPQTLTPHHRHHLHQRAAPITSPHHYMQQRKMSYCNGNKIYQNLYQQMNASMLYIKQLCANYLRDRGNETFEDMSETWKLISLETRNPNRKQVFIENELHKKIHDFYLNLHTFDQLIDYASQDTNDNKTKIEHGEEISIDKIIKFLQSVKAEIKFNMKEAENLLDILEIEKPNLADNAVVFNSNISRRVRDFLIIKNLIEEFEHVLHLVQNYCENTESE